MSTRTPNSVEPQAGGHETTVSRAAGTVSLPPDYASTQTFRRVSADADRVVRDLLRHRLRVACGMILFVFVTLLGVFTAIGANDPVLWAVSTPFGLALSGLLLLAPLASAVTLWLNPGLALPALRRLELLTFGSVAAYIWYFRYTALTGEPTAGGIDPTIGLKLVTAISLIIEILALVYYGVFIPNTWRRCVTVCATFVCGQAAATLAAAATRPLVAAELPFVMAVSSVDWIAASVLAAYGSFRISTLQKQVIDARRVGQYTLRKRLGAGGMGEVYFAEHAHLRRPAAVKLIRPERVGDPSVLLRFEREGQATATLTHPNTVQIYDYGLTDDGTFYYVMEYLPGLTLDQLVARTGPLPAGRAVHLLRQVCGALREAHATGLVHRDIKPSNIMVCERGGLHDVVKLLDFGLVLPRGDAADAEKLTREGTVTGTPAYMSPEQADAHAALDARTDGYSLGAVAYHLLTGQPPFAGRSALKMLAAHLYEPPRPPRELRPDVPPDLEAVVLRCLAKSPADRFADVAALDAALAGCRDAGRWTEADAAAWWHANPRPPERGEC